MLKSPLATKWIPPPLGWVKINFDVAIIRHLSMVVAVGRNDLGEVLFAHTSLFPPSLPLQEEINNALLALNLFALHNLSYVQFEGDSKVVIFFNSSR